MSGHFQEHDPAPMRRVLHEMAETASALRSACIELADELEVMPVAALPTRLDCLDSAAAALYGQSQPLQRLLESPAR